MFSKGQIFFAVIFFILFASVVFVAYRKDRKLHKKYYGGVLWILLTFISFFLAMAAIKFFMGY